jgi:hypothetical protein
MVVEINVGIEKNYFRAFECIVFIREPIPFPTLWRDWTAYIIRSQS